MNQVYPVVGEVASDGHSVTDANYQNSVKSNATDAYIWSHTIPHNKVSDWVASYERVLYCNIVLDGLKKLAPSGDADLLLHNNIKGQALFIRALTFYCLSQLYTPVYNSQTANTNLGIVLRLSSDIVQQSARSTIKETYDQIISDIKTARDLLPDEPEFLTRASKIAAVGLLARVYLSMSDYTNALSAANDYLKKKNELLDFNDLSKTQNYIGRYNMEVAYHTTFTHPFITSRCNIDTDLYDEYGVNDLRKVIFFKKASNGVVTFKGNYESSTSSLFNGIATDEIYLIRAECNARANNVDDAMEDLNKLLKARWDESATFVSLSASDSEIALRLTLKERKKELILRGLRWTDLRRLNGDSRFATTLTRDVAGEKYILEPGSFRYCFPIPDDIQAQTKIQQNPEWVY